MASIRKRSWRTASGEVRERWQVDFRDQNGARVHKQFDRKKDADAFMVTARGQVERGTFSADSASVTVSKAGDLWLERCDRDKLEAATLKQYRSHTTHHLKPKLGAVKLSRLTTPMVEQLVDDLLAGGRSRALVKKILASLKAILKDSQRRGLVAQNVAVSVTVRIPARHKKAVEIPTREEIRERIDGAQGRWRPLVVTAIFTGMRASELRGLAWDNVDLKAQVIRVRQRADADGKIGSLKSASARRDIPMAPMLVDALREWKLACPKGDLGLVFPNGRGNVESHANIVQRGLGTGLHRYRHFFASWLIDQGFGPKRVQALMGHSTIQMTFDTYGSLFPQDDDAERFAAGELALVG
jgi:integrase